jgi:plasmid stabilization system protein ParE
LLKSTLHPGARKDIAEASKFYWSQAGVKSTQGFFNEFERILTLLLERPGLGSSVGGNRRRHPMGNYPYWIIYYVKGDKLVVLAVAHQNRRPDYWSRRK